MTTTDPRIDRSAAGIHTWVWSWAPTIPVGACLGGRVTVVGGPPSLGRGFAARASGAGRIRMDHRPAGERDPQRTIVQAVDAVRAAVAAGERLVWVTRGGAGHQARPDPAGAALIAFARVAAREHPDTVVGVLDLDPDAPPPSAEVMGPRSSAGANPCGRGSAAPRPVRSRCRRQQASPRSLAERSG